MTPSRRKAREPVQVYLDPDDKSLLERVARSTDLPQAEILRRGLRRIAADLLTEAKPGFSLGHLMGALEEGEGAEDLPADLAARHDEYLYPPEHPRGPGGD